MGISKYYTNVIAKEFRFVANFSLKILLLGNRFGPGNSYYQLFLRLKSVFIDHRSHTNIEESNYTMVILLLFKNGSKSEKCFLLSDTLKCNINHLLCIYHYIITKIIILNAGFYRNMHTNKMNISKATFKIYFS